MAETRVPHANTLQLVEVYVADMVKVASVNRIHQGLIDVKALRVQELILENRRATWKVVESTKVRK